MKPGSLLAGRFALGSRLELDYGSTEAWIAADARLDARVTLLVVTGAGQRAVQDAAEIARVSRDARLARIVDIGHVGAHEGDDDAGHAGGSTYVAIERPSGLAVSALLASRILPLPVARALVREAAKALDAANARGLRHSGSLTEMLTVTGHGRVVLSGAGVVASLAGGDHGRHSITTRSDLMDLARLLFSAVTASADAGGALDLDALPDGLTSGERDVAGAIASGTPGGSLADFIDALGPSNINALRALDVASRGFPRRARTPLEPPVESGPDVETQPGVAGAPVKVDAAGVVVVEAPPVNADALAVGALRADETERLPWGADEDDEWGLDSLEVLEPNDHLPPVTDALIAYLERHFPRLEPATHRLRTTRERLQSLPTVPPTVLMGVAMVALVGFAIWGIAWFRAPFVYTGDLHDQPPHSYPEFTLGTDESPAPSP